MLNANTLSTISKAIGGGLGGAAGGTVAGVAGAVALLPAGSPAWMYFVIVLAEMAVAAVPAAIGAYSAPANRSTGTPS